MVAQRRVSRPRATRALQSCKSPHPLLVDYSIRCKLFHFSHPGTQNTISRLSRLAVFMSSAGPTSELGCFEHHFGTRPHRMRMWACGLTGGTDQLAASLADNHGVLLRALHLATVQMARVKGAARPLITCRALQTPSYPLLSTFLPAFSYHCTSSISTPALNQSLALSARPLYIT